MSRSARPPPRPMTMSSAFSSVAQAAISRGSAADLHHRFDADALGQRLCEMPRLVRERFAGVLLGAVLGPGGEVAGNDVKQRDASSIGQRQKRNSAEDAVRNGRQIDGDEQRMEAPRPRPSRAALCLTLASSDSRSSCGLLSMKQGPPRTTSSTAPGTAESRRDGGPRRTRQGPWRGPLSRAPRRSQGSQIREAVIP